MRIRSRRLWWIDDAIMGLLILVAAPLLGVSAVIAFGAEPHAAHPDVVAVNYETVAANLALCERSLCRKCGYFYYATHAMGYVWYQMSDCEIKYSKSEEAVIREEIDKHIRREYGPDAGVKP